MTINRIPFLSLFSFWHDRNIENILVHKHSHLEISKPRFSQHIQELDWEIFKLCVYLINEMPLQMQDQFEMDVGNKNHRKREMD